MNEPNLLQVLEISETTRISTGSVFSFTLEYAMCTLVGAFVVISNIFIRPNCFTIEGERAPKPAKTQLSARIALIQLSNG